MKQRAGEPRDGAVMVVTGAADGGGRTTAIARGEAVLSHT